MLDITELRTRIAGPVLTPADDGFAEECPAWIQTFTHTPDVAIGATSAIDVSAAITFALANLLPVRIQATGHGSEVQIDDGVLILTKRLDTLVVDSAAKTATIGAGVTWGRVVAAAAEHGLAPVTGSASSVGAVGLILGGGIGPLARSFGFASDYARAFEIVVADGSIVTANSSENPDLFWALRGGKGGLGVVTSVTVELIELTTFYGGSLTFDAPDIEAAFRAWVDFTATADADVTTSVAILRLPDFDFIPAPIRGRTLLSVRFAYSGDTADGEKLAAPLRAAAPVYLDALGEMDAADVAKINNDPEEGGIAWTRGGMFDSVDQDFATTLLKLVGPEAHVPLISVEIRHIGSATDTDVPEGSAVGGRGVDFTFNLVGAPDPSLFQTVLPGLIAGISSALAQWTSASNTVNFAGNFASDSEFRSAWPSAIFEKLESVRKQYDPSGVFPYGPRKD
jgi:FAD/FMN-containing dehydrogenase